jgi:ribosome-binding protein aMBF1 (putative translation factor)
MRNESICKLCFGNFDKDTLIWGDRGAFFLVCSDCYKTETRANA